MNDKKEYPFLTVEQPIGRFYALCMKSIDLIPIAESQERTPYNSTGIQRSIDKKRVLEIKEYCEKPNAMFPTPIILSGKSKYFNFYDDHHKNSDFFDVKNGFLSINFKAIKDDKKFLSIVDGQHRLKGIEESGLADKFDVLVLLTFDTENYEDAEIFSIINRNQKQVSKSLVYDLYGLSNDMTIEKFAHELVNNLNTNKKSDLKNKIKMLGYKTDEFQLITQGALVDQLIPLISSNPSKDNILLEEGRALVKNSENPLRKYLISAELEEASLNLIEFFNAWLKILNKKNFNGTILYKTVGFIAAIKIFGEINKDYPKLNYNEYLSNLDFDKLDPNTISSSLSGAKKIFNTLLGRH